MADRQRSEISKQQVIVMLPSKFLKKPMNEYFLKSKEWYDKYDVKMLADDDVGNTSPNSLYNYVSKLIKSSLVPPLVIPTHDTGAIVHAALAMKFPHIRAPSLLSEFLCLHKGETYKIAPKEFTLPYLQLAEDASVELNDLATAKISGFPVFVKASFGTNSDMVKKVNDVSELNTFVESKRERIRNNATDMCKFLSMFLDVTLVENAIRKPWVVQPYVDGNARLVAVDGLVSNGKATMWNIHEFVFWNKSSSEMKCFASPVDLSTKAEEHLLKAYDFIIKELLSRGFTDQFAALEAFVTKDGKVSIVEVNGRTLRMMCRSYVQMYGENGDIVRAMIQIAEGKVPEAPVAIPGVHICIGYVCLFDKGLAKDFIDFEAAKCIKEIELKVAEDDAISPPGEWGHQVAYCYTSGKSRDEAMETCRTLVDKCVIAKDKCKWLTN